ncbi:MAG TPA: DegQ family serine endoprotease [Castellaniella sp.]|uniref:DegQ family serine endoprotease n=1 Tax=Castellaniella sp. TaxID=1955812 RepID=UPI002EE018B1
MALNLTGGPTVKRAVACAAASLLLVAGVPVGAAYAEAAPVPTIALPDFTQVVAQTEGSVVNVRTTEAVPVSQPQDGQPNPQDLFRWFFGPDAVPPGMEQQNPKPKRHVPHSGHGKEKTVPYAIGSGFIISSDGYILTNDHVVKGANGVSVTLNDGKEYKAKVVGTDAPTDIALLKIDATGLKPLVIGDSDKLKKGQWVLAIGSPFGLDSTVTAGIVSAINRNTGDYLPFIQTDVAVNPGNSGGPLLNLKGQVVGINSQIISRSGGFMGISLSIPIDEVMRVVDQLKAHGKVTRGKIGVEITAVQSDVAKALGLGEDRGALVSSVSTNGPAAKAGIHAGDVITRYNGQEIQHAWELPRLVGQTKPGTEVKVEVWRKGKALDLTVKIAELKFSSSGEPGEMPQQVETTDRLGLVVGPLQSDATVTQGVVVKKAKGLAADAGIQPGDVIERVNDTDITSPAQFNQIISSTSKSQPVALLVSRDGQSQWVILSAGQ